MPMHSLQSQGNEQVSVSEATEQRDVVRAVVGMTSASMLAMLLAITSNGWFPEEKGRGNSHQNPASKTKEGETVLPQAQLSPTSEPLPE